MDKQGIIATLQNAGGKLFETWLPPFEVMPDALIVDNQIWIRQERTPHNYVQAQNVFHVAPQYVAEHKSEDEKTLEDMVNDVPPAARALALVREEVSPGQMSIGEVTLGECEPCGKPVCESLPSDSVMQIAAIAKQKAALEAAQQVREAGGTLNDELKAMALADPPMEMSNCD